MKTIHTEKGLMWLQSTLSVIAVVITIQAIRWCPDALAATPAQIQTSEAKAAAMAEMACGYGYAYLAAHNGQTLNPNRFNFRPPTPFAVEANGSLSAVNLDEESVVVKIESISNDSMVVCAVATSGDSTAVHMIELHGRGTASYYELASVGKGSLLTTAFN